ncbi:MAG: hypothetical protein ACR2QC_02460 [Gammaproteobacteria bacterium]
MTEELTIEVPQNAKPGEAVPVSDAPVPEGEIPEEVVVAENTKPPAPAGDPSWDTYITVDDPPPTDEPAIPAPLPPLASGKSVDIGSQNGQQSGDLPSRGQIDTKMPPWTARRRQADIGFAKPSGITRIRNMEAYVKAKKGDGQILMNARAATFSIRGGKLHMHVRSGQHAGQPVRLIFDHDGQS